MRPSRARRSTHPQRGAGRPTVHRDGPPAEAVEFLLDPYSEFEAASASPAAAPVPARHARPAPVGPDWRTEASTRLRRIESLRAEGLISTHEYDERRKVIIGRL